MVSPWRCALPRSAFSVLHDPASSMSCSMARPQSEVCIHVSHWCKEADCGAEQLCCACTGGHCTVAVDCRGDQAALQQAHLHLLGQASAPPGQRHLPGGAGMCLLPVSTQNSGSCSTWNSDEANYTSNLFVFAAQVHDIKRMNWSMNTDVNAVFTLLLQASVYPIATVDQNQEAGCLLPVIHTPGPTCDCAFKPAVFLPCSAP